MSVRDTDVEDAWGEFVEERVSRGSLLRRAGLLGMGAIATPALLGGTSAFAADTVPSSGKTLSLADLITKAQKEGTVNTITLPPTWANYGEIMKTYQSKFKLKLTDAIPDGTSAQELSAIKRRRAPSARRTSSTSGRRSPRSAARAASSRPTRSRPGRASPPTSSTRAGRGWATTGA